LHYQWNYGTHDYSLWKPAASPNSVQFIEVETKENPMILELFSNSSTKLFFLKG
jgi:hypothetical protein